jgi:hypothetical protein
MGKIPYREQACPPRYSVYPPRKRESYLELQASEIMQRINNTLSGRRMKRVVAQPPLQQRRPVAVAPFDVDMLRIERDRRDLVTGV